MTPLPDPYRRSGLEGARRAVQNLPPRDRKLLLEFMDHCLGTGLSERRACKLAYDLLLAHRMGFPFRRTDRKTVEKFNAKLNSDPDHAPWTKVGVRVAAKKFYRWLLGAETDPPETAWLKSLDRKLKNQTLPEDLLTPQEAEAMVRAADNDRDRAIIALLYETGCRVGEILSMRLKDVQLEGIENVTFPTGKTGGRRNRILASVPYLSAWVAHHPLAGSPNGPLWAVNYHGEWQAMGYGTVVQILKSAARAAGIKKRVNPHNFRHSRATELAQHLTEAQMKARFGWTQDSKMAAVYIHLSGRDDDAAYEKMYGIERPAEGNGNGQRLPRPCPRCQSPCPPEGAFCLRCGAPADAAQAIRRDAEAVETLKAVIGKLDGLVARIEALERRVSG